MRFSHQPRADITVDSLARSSARLTQFNEILSGAETLVAFTSDDRDVQRGLTVEPVEQRVELPVKREGYRVPLIRPVDGDEHDGVGWERG